jgi:hypothetical protein
MSANKDNADAQVLYWPGKLFSADDLRKHWNNQRELVLSRQTLITPLAQDELRAKGISIRREQTAANGDRPSRATAKRGWGCVQEHSDSVVDAALAAVAHEGMAFTPLAGAGRSPGGWLRAVGDWMAANVGAVLFCADATLSCCLANKVAGLRAAAVANGRQVGRAFASLGANTLVVEMPGQTFFEVRQILRAASAGRSSACPPEVAKILAELEGHAHR